MTPIEISALVTAGMRMYADFADRAAAGTITHEDIQKMLGMLGHTLDTWQAKVDAHKASPLAAPIAR